ncbi:MAG: hypothetical protein ACFB0C_05785 [Leptolyngbyaceae cyanobacterium]
MTNIWGQWRLTGAGFCGKKVAPLKRPMHPIVRRRFDWYGEPSASIILAIPVRLQKPALARSGCNNSAERRYRQLSECDAPSRICNSDTTGF